MGKKKHKASKKKKNTSKSTIKNFEEEEKVQTKYQQLNENVKDMLRAVGIDSEKLDFKDNPDKTKVSAAILKMAEPYIKKYWGNENRVRQIIFLAITIWNMSFLPLEKQNELQEKWIDNSLPEDCDAQDVAVMLRVFENIQDRKNDLFPGIRTFIMGYDIRIDSENIHLDISSAPLDKEDLVL